MRYRGLVLAMSMLVAFPFACSKKDASSNKAFVTFTVGDSFYSRGAAWERLEVGSALSERDRIKTEKSSTVDVQIGQSVLRIKEKSEVILQTIFKDKTTGLESTSLELTVGMVMAKPKKLVRGESFMVKTPTAVAGVRGTMFTVESTPERNTRVSVVDGKVSVAKRIVAIENIEESAVKESEAVKKIEEHIENTAVTVTENKTCEVRGSAIEEANKKVEKIVEQVAAKAEDKKAQEKKAENAVQEAEKLIEAMSTVPVIKTEVLTGVTGLKAEFESMQVVETPEEKETSAEKSEVKISVKPNNASIFLNGEMVGSGTVKLSLLPGVYTIKAEAEGYEIAEKKITVEEGKRLADEIALEEMKPLDRVRWNLDMKDPINGIVHSGKHVFVATEKGKVFAINRENTKRVWEHSMSSGISSGLAFDSNTLYFATADEKFHALSAADGSVQWSEPIDGAMILRVTPLVASGSIYVATSRGVVYSFNRRGGTSWKTRIKAAILETPVLADGNILAWGIDGKLHCLKSGSGRERWMIDAGKKFKVAVSEGFVYTVSYYGTITAINMEDGKTVWKKELGESVIASPLVFKDRLYIGTLSGRLYACALKDGAVLFRRGLGGPIRNTMTVANNIIHIASGNTLNAIDANGAVQWRYDVQSRITTAASVTDNEIFVGLDRGRVVSMNRSLERVR